MSNLRVPRAKEYKYLIWSNQHGAFWGPNENGYTKDIHEAGRYSKGETMRIILHSMMYEGKVDNQFAEVAMLAPGSWDTR